MKDPSNTYSLPPPSTVSRAAEHIQVVLAVCEVADLGTEKLAPPLDPDEMSDQLAHFIEQLVSGHTHLLEHPFDAAMAPPRL